MSLCGVTKKAQNTTTLNITTQLRSIFLRSYCGFESSLSTWNFVRDPEIKKPEAEPEAEPETEPEIRKNTNLSITSVRCVGWMVVVKNYRILNLKSVKIYQPADM